MNGTQVGLLKLSAISHVSPRGCSLRTNSNTLAQANAERRYSPTPVVSVRPVCPFSSRTLTHESSRARRRRGPLSHSALGNAERRRSSREAEVIDRAAGTEACARDQVSVR